jgi:hypothetical protein
MRNTTNLKDNSSLLVEWVVSEVRPIIRCLFLKTAFWVDFLIPLSPNLKNLFKTRGNASLAWTH